MDTDVELFLGERHYFGRCAGDVIACQRKLLISSDKCSDKTQGEKYGK